MDPRGTYSVGSITKKWILEVPSQLGPLQKMDPGGTYSVGSITKKWILEVPTQLGPLRRNGSWKYLLSWVHYKKWILKVPTQLDPLQINGTWRYLLSWIHYKEMDPGGTYSVGSITNKWILKVPTQLGPLQRTNLSYCPTVKRQAHLGNNLINRKCSPAAKWAHVIVTSVSALRRASRFLYLFIYFN